MEGHTNIIPSTRSDRVSLQLDACQILITHTQGSDTLLNTLTQAGGICHHQPLLDIVPKKISSMKQKICYDADIWIFLSQHSIAHNSQLLKSCLDCQTIITVGPGTAQKLEDQGLFVDAMPAHEFNINGILKLAHIQSGESKKILLFSESSAPQTLTRELRKRGHEVCHIPTYQQQPVNETEWVEQINAHNIAYHYVTIHSQNGFCHLLRCLQTHYCNHLMQATLVVTTSAMQTLARKHGFQQVLLSNDNSPEQLMKTITNDYTRRSA